MHSHHRRRRSFARLLLALAGLLYLLATAAEPLLHAYAAPGTTRLQFILWHGDHADGETGPIELQVVN